MAAKFRKQAIKFLQKASPEDLARIQDQIGQLVAAVEEQGVIPFTDLDIKKMRGSWEGFYRLRVGKVRIIFSVNLDSFSLEIYSIASRGDIYK